MPSPFTISIEPHFGRKKRIWRQNQSEDLFFLEIATILGQNSEFGDEIKVETFFFFFRDHCDGERKNGESKHTQEWNF